MNLIDRLHALLLWVLGILVFVGCVAAIGLMARLVIKIFCIGYGC